MPTQQGYSGQAGYGRQRQQHATVTGQYDSAFNPIPIEFLQEQLRGRQGQYDAAFAGALEQQDAMAQQQVGMADIADKNQLIQEGMGSIDKMVEEKYGGDWGRASKEVARHVTQIRSDPFWNAQAEVEKKRTAYQERVDKFGPDALQFGADPRQLTTRDAIGKVRGVDEFTGEVVQKGDYLATARELMSGITPDDNPWGLSEAAIDNFVQYGQVKEVDRDKIEQFASDPSIQEALLSRHGEIRRSGELSEAQQKQHGFFGKTPEEFAQTQLLGAAGSAQFRQSTQKIAQDAAKVKAAGQTIETDPEYIASTSTPQIEQGDNKLLDAHTTMMKGNHGSAKRTSAINFQDPQTGVNYTMQSELMSLTSQYNNGNMTAEELNDARDKTTQKYKDLATNQAEGQMTKKEAQELNKEEYWEALQEQYEDLSGINPETNKPYTRDEGFQIMSDHYQRQNAVKITTHNLKLSNTEKNVKDILFSNLNAGNFEADAFTDTATGDVYDNRNLPSKLGYGNYTEMVDNINNQKIKLIPKINFSTGKMEVQIPGRKGGFFKRKPVQPVDVGFNADNESKLIISTGQVFTERLKDTNSYPEAEADLSMNGGQVVPMLDWNGKVSPLPAQNKMTGQQRKNGGVPGGYQSIAVTGTGSVVNGNDKKLWVINYDQQGNPVSRKTISLADAQKMVGETVDKRFQNIEGPTGNTGVTNK